jgi:hypothetical protein
MQGDGRTQLALPLGAFLGQDMATMRLASLEAAGYRLLEALGRASICFDLGHCFLLRIQI